jgi:hypothetical protein
MLYQNNDFLLHMKSCVLLFEMLASFYEILGSNFEKITIGLTGKLLAFLFGHLLTMVGMKI